MSGSYDLAILGAGPGGYVAALRAAQLGARVALVERDRVGGTCLNIGCIPTKALTTSVELLLKARRASEFGVSIPSALPDLPSLMAYKQAAVDRLVSGVERLLKERKVTLGVTGIFGEVFLGAELGRIDEDAGHNIGILSAGLADQGQVPLVEVAHGGHKAYSARHLPPGIPHL